MSEPSRTRAPSVKLAALVPAWNPGSALITTLQSIAAQPVQCDIFVVDDGSQPAIELPSSINGKAVQVLRKSPNGGITAALNTGLDAILSGGYEFISRHDCGDLDHPDRLATQLRYMHAHPRVMLVGTSVMFAASDGGVRFLFKAPSEQAGIDRKMHYSAAVVHSSCMFRASLFATDQRYSAQYPHAEDYELFFRVSAAHQVRNVPEVLVTASYNPDGISIRNRSTSLVSRLRIQMRYFDPLSVHSYLGVLQTLALCVIPYSLVSRCKSLPLRLASK